MVGALHLCRQQLGGLRQVAEVPDAEPAAPHLVLVAGADAAPGGADVLAPLAGHVEHLVQREHQVGAVRHEQAPVGDRTTLREAVQFREELLRVQHHAIADDAGSPRVQDARGDLVEHVLLIADDDGVPGVRAALVAHHQVGSLGEHVHQLALPLITPLRAHYDDTSGAGVEHDQSPLWQQKSPSRGC